MTAAKTLQEYVTDLRAMASGEPTIIDPSLLADAIEKHIRQTGLRVIQGGKECVLKDHSEDHHLPSAS